jgi:3(or 17)beta-hydroxysteroid dehydrogenase
MKPMANPTTRVSAVRILDTMGAEGVIDLTLVNSIHPGVIETDMREQTFVSRARNHGTNDVEAARQAAMSRHPIGRLGMPDDIAKGFVFLASDDAGFMTGSGLVIDGGSTAH